MTLIEYRSALISLLSLAARSTFSPDRTSDCCRRRFLSPSDPTAQHRRYSTIPRLVFGVGGLFNPSVKEAEELLPRYRHDNIFDSTKFTTRYSEALEHITERQLRRLIKGGQVAALSRGLYRKADSLGDDDLIEIASRSPSATICLRSALARHELIDDIPDSIDIAILRGSWTPETSVPVRWRHFDPATFSIGRGLLDIGRGRGIGLYTPERSIIDAFRMRHLGGPDLANESLKRWLRRGGQPSELLTIARSFPRTQTVLRQTLEVLL